MRTKRLPALLALLVAACASVQWTRDGASDADLTRDLADCRKEAALRFPGGTIGLPSAPIDPRFGGPGGPSAAESQMQEQVAVANCMRARGYQLVPKPD